MKRVFIFAISALLLTLAVNSVQAYETLSETTLCPWVYPTTEANPTTTEYYMVLLTGGYSQINLVLWNHDPEYDFVLGKFVIAIESGVEQITIDSINLAFDTEDLSGTSTPGDGTKSMPGGGIFPCPWKQYDVGINLTERQYNDGWHGAGDPSGIQITIEITVNTDPANVHLYFVAWGYNDKGDGNLDWTKTPYSHITETFPPPPPVIPEVPVGSVMAASSMLVALGAYFGLRKRKIRFTS